MKNYFMLCITQLFPNLIVNIHKNFQINNKIITLFCSIRFHSYVFVWKNDKANRFFILKNANIDT